MENLAELIQSARTFEGAGQERSALDCYLRALTVPDAAPDTSLQARVGMLQLRLGELDAGAEMLARASDAYAAAGLRNNALALCEEVFQLHPARTDFLRRLVELSTAQGYREDARHWMNEYLNRADGGGDAAGVVDLLRAYVQQFPTEEWAKERLTAIAGEEPRRETPPVLPPADRLPERTPSGDDLGLLTNAPDDAVLPSRDTPSGTTAATPGSTSDAPEVMPLEGLEPTTTGTGWDHGLVNPDPLPVLGSALDETDSYTKGADEVDADPLPLLSDFPALGPGDAKPEAPAVEDAPGEGAPPTAGADDPARYYDLGVAFKEIGLWDDAIAQFRSALNAGAEPVSTLEMLGECYLEKGEAERAVAVLERAVQLADSEGSDSIGVHYWLGRSHEAAGAVEPARESYRRVVHFNREFRDAFARLRRLDEP